MTTQTAGHSGEQPVSVSFVIPALNEERFIRRCLDSIYKLTLPAGVSGVEVIVVDNESTDRTAEICQELGAKVVSTPPGRASRARNRGASIATGTWIAFIDADCEVLPDWLEQCLPLLSDNKVVAVGCRVIPPSTSRAWVACALARISPPRPADATTCVKWIASAGLLLARSDFIAIGGFDEGMATCEDCDLGYRLSEQGSLLVNHHATLIHHGESTTLSEVFFREAWRTRDNLRLALNNPHDIRNWASFLIPLIYTATLACGLIGSVLTISLGASPSLWIGLLFLALLMPLAIVIIKYGSSNILSVLQASAVLSIYFLGRTAGCLYRFPRLERAEA
jgi:glycosyltransferase involved in cell wall biosynthesis